MGQPNSNVSYCIVISDNSVSIKSTHWDKVNEVSYLFTDTSYYYLTVNIHSDTGPGDGVEIGRKDKLNAAAYLTIRSLLLSAPMLPILSLFC